MADQPPPSRNDIIILPAQNNHPGNIKIEGTIEYVVARIPAHANRNHIRRKSQKIYDYCIDTGRRFVKCVRVPQPDATLENGEIITLITWEDVDENLAGRWVFQRLFREFRNR